MIYGVLHPDEGRDPLRRPAAHYPEPEGGARHGRSAMVFQHFSLFEALTCAREHRARAGRAAVARRPREAHSRGARALRADARPAPDGRRRCRSASGSGSRSCAALLLNPKLLIMDEPTSVLTPQEVRSSSRRCGRCGRGLLDPLHQPQAARDRGALRRGDDPARGQGRGRVRAGRGELAVDGGDDDRRQPQGHPQGRGAGARDGEVRGRGAEPRRPGDFDVALKDVRFSVRPARSSGSPGSPATGRTSWCWRSRARRRARPRR